MPPQPFQQKHADAATGPTAGVEWAAGKWAIVMHAYSAEKKGEMELVFRQVIRLEQGHPRNFWKGFYPASGHSGPLRRRRSLPAWRADSALSAVLSAGLFPKHHVSLLNKAIVIEDCPSPGPGGLALRRDEVVVICSTVMKKKVDVQKDAKM